MTKQIPSLRFPQFAEHSEWEEKKLGEICKNISSGKSKTKIEVAKYPLYGSTGIIGYANNYDYNGEKILIARVGANAGTLYKVNGFYSVTDNTLIVDVLDLQISNLNFIYYYLIVKNLNKLVFGSGQPLITGGQLKNLVLNFPTFPEQTQIADFLTAVDKRISLLKQKYELLQSYKKGIMQQIFSQELRFKDDAGQDFPEWEEKTLGEVFKLTRGKVLAMNEVSDFKDNFNLYPVYSSQTQKKGLAGYFKNYLFENCITWTTDGANAGTVNYRKGKFYCTNVCGVLVNEEGYCNQYVADYLNTVTKKYVSYVGNPKLMNNVMETISIPLPCLSEQKKIAEFLTAIDDKIEKTKQQLAQSEEWKRGLLQCMLV